MRQVFSTVQKELQLVMVPDAWLMYVRPLTPASFEKGVLTVETPDAFVQEVCEVRLDKMIRREMAAHVGRTIETRYVVRKKADADGNG